MTGSVVDVDMVYCAVGWCYFWLLGVNRLSCRVVTLWRNIHYQEFADITCSISRTVLGYELVSEGRLYEV